MLNDNDYQYHKHNIKEKYKLTLDDIKPGQSGIILSIGGQGMLRRRLLEMGLTPNTRVKVRKVAPMGDPIELSLRSYVLTIRKEEASKIELKEVTCI
ncbi:MAG: ferrous iron transport protein A [Sedimentibacter sp.]